MKDEQRPLEGSDCRHQLVAVEILQQLASKSERPSSEPDLDLILKPELRCLLAELPAQVFGIGWCAEGRKGKGATLLTQRIN